jgi:hypothetical protein
MSESATHAMLDDRLELIIGGLPTTWPTDAEVARKLAIDIARRHADGVALLNELADEHGGGLVGVAVGVVGLLERRRLITATDGQRLRALFQAFDARADDRAATVREVRELERAANQDHGSGAVALSILSVASSELAEATTTDSDFVAGQVATLADLAGIGLGSPGGPAGSLIVGVAASTVAAQTVNVIAG